MGFNAVRYNGYWGLMQPYNETLNGINPEYFATGEDPLGVGLDQLVNWAIQENMYIIIGEYPWTQWYPPPQWAFPGVSDNATRIAMLFNGTAAREIIGLTNLWKYIASRYANVPNVLFEFMNEPYLTSSTDYLAGSGYATFNEQLISAIESVETQSHLKLVELVYKSANDWEEIVSGTVDIAKPNVVWVTHYYAPMDSYDPNGKYWVAENFTWNGQQFQSSWHNGSTYIAWRLIRVVSMIHSWNKPWFNDEFSKDTAQANWQSWLGSVMQISTQYQIAGWWYFCYTHNTDNTDSGWNLNIASVANAVMAVLEPYMAARVDVTPVPIPEVASSLLLLSLTLIATISLIRSRRVRKMAA
jgi:hypothetical protein